MNKLNKIKLSGFRLFLLSALLMLSLVGCGGGSNGGGKEALPPTIQGTALIPGGSVIPKTGFSKALPGSGAFTGSKVRAQSLTTGVVFDSLDAVTLDGAFKIEDIPFGDDYLLSARKGNQVVYKLVTIPANASTPFPIGQIDLTSTAIVHRVERAVQENSGETVRFRPGEIITYNINIINEIHFLDPEALMAVLEAIAREVLDDSGKIKDTADLNALFKDVNGDVDIDGIANINIYLTFYQIFISGNPGGDENGPDVITIFINGGSGNVIADTVINNFGEITIINNVVTPADLKDNLDAITKPQTTITGKPENPTPSSSARFSFISSREGSTFKCQLDVDPFSNCSSPIDYSGLDLGLHTFCVVTTDNNGNIDPTPACFEWTIDLPDVPINFAQDPPTAVTLAVGATTTASSVLASSINPEGTETRAYFEWGVDTNYGNTTGLKEVGSGFNSIAISEILTGLSSATEYHFRVVGVNLWGISVGDDQLFVTD